MGTASKVCVLVCVGLVLVAILATVLLVFSFGRLESDEGNMGP